MVGLRSRLSIILVSLWIASTRTKKQPCAFVTENNKCCKLPFEFNNRNYTGCTADVTEKKWSDQWRNPWCFPEGGDRSTKHPCYKSGPSCGGVRTQVAGVFSSANFPNNYTNNTTCSWRISVELANHITLNFTDFDLENSSGCENAYVHVYDGLNTTDPSLGKFCGGEIPPGVRSSGSKMLVIFHGYNGARYKGFRAYYDSGNCDVRSYGGNGGGACCVFPFTYKGKVYNKCTEDDETIGLAWCSVTSDYERDRKRGHCVSENVSCGPNKFECLNHHWWKQCIDEKYRCDGYQHCADHSDETDCPPTMNPDSCKVMHVVLKRNGQGRVGFVLNRKCNYKDRCAGVTNTSQAVDVPCNFSDWFKCSNGRCVPDYWRCDGKDDCGDRSDELSGCSFQVQACSWVTYCAKTRWETSLGNKPPVKVKTPAICYRKDLRRIPTYLPVKITKLVIKETKLTTIERFSFARYEHLEEIDLEGNVIERIQENSFIKLQSLKTLILKRNKLRVLKTGTFEGLRSLTKLDLEENPLEQIEARAFNGLKHLQKLNLSNMDLRTISSEAFHGMDSLTEL